MKNKKVLKALAALTLGGTAAFGLVFAGCSHEHTFDESKWGGSDATGHWHEATCEHTDEKGGFSKHNYGTDGNGQYCLDCNYENPDYKAPAQATKLSAPVITLTDGVISWSAVQHATGYEVHKDGTKVTDVTATSYTIADGAYGAYTVKATSTDTANYSISDASNTVNYTAPAEEGYTITLNAGEGTLTTESLKTANGKLSSLPSPKAPAGYKFKGWFDSATGGNAITTETVFDEDCTIYAQYQIADGVYSKDGKLLFELEWVEPDDSAKRQYGSEDIALEPGDEFVIKIDGEVLTHNVGTLELWLANDCHGVTLNQANGTFTVKEQAGEEGERGFKLYAKYYTDGTPCWSISVTDGLTDNLVAGGAYLVGTGWSTGSWNITADNYIDPENGLTVTLSKDADFKITDCLDVPEGENRGWQYNDPTFYLMKSGSEDGYLNFANVGASGNIKVLTPGTYTITVVISEDEDGEKDIKFCFEPEEGLKPAPIEAEFVTGGAYLVGTGFAESAVWTLNKNYYINPEGGLTVTLGENAEVQITDCTNGLTGSMGWSYKSDSLFEVKDAGEGKAYILFSGGAGKVLAKGEYTITVTYNGETPLFHFEPAEGVEPAQLEAEYVKGGAYLVGTGFSDDAVWNLNNDYYINPEGGLTVTLKAGASVQITDCTNGYSGAMGWSYKSDSMFEVKDAGEGYAYITFSGGTGTVLAEGEYTITVTYNEGTPLFHFEPAEGVDPVKLVEPIVHYYIKGAMVTSWANKTDAEFEMTLTEGVYELTIDLAAGDEFMFWSQDENPDTGVLTDNNTRFIQSGALAEGITCVTVKGANMLTVEEGTYKFTFDTATGKLNIEFTAKSEEGGEVTPEPDPEEPTDPVAPDPEQPSETEETPEE